MFNVFTIDDEQVHPDESISEINNEIDSANVDLYSEQFETGSISSVWSKSLEFIHVSQEAQWKYFIV